MPRANDGKMQTLQKQVGNRVRELREKKGLSQEALASVCDLHRTYVGLIERGERNLSLTTLEQLAKGLEVPVSELLVGSERLPTQTRRPSAKARPIQNDLAAHVAAIRQILIDAKLTDAKRYEALLIACRKQRSRPA